MIDVGCSFLSQHKVVMAYIHARRFTTHMEKMSYLGKAFWSFKIMRKSEHYSVNGLQANYSEASFSIDLASASEKVRLAL